MPSVRDVSSHIAVLRNMQKVMRAMSMIATIKLRRLYRLQSSLPIFENCIERIAQDSIEALRESPHPVVAERKAVRKVHAIIFTADKGLCGSHNNSAQRALDALVESKAKQNITADITCIGIRGAHYCKRKGYDVYYRIDSNERTVTTVSLAEISSKVLKRFLDDEIQEVYLIANYFISTLHQQTRTLRLIPFSPAPAKGAGKKRTALDMTTEPHPEKFIVSAAERYLFYTLRSALFNSYLSEHSSRMTAMENATKNSEDLIDRYVAIRNRARQAAITNELIEIISGKEALKG